MAWNEPGGGSRDPWGGGRGDQGPPDLDEVFRRLSRRLGGLFGGRRGGVRVGGSGGGSLLVLAALAVWLLSGIYIVGPAERGVVLRFGKYVETTLPGPHWHWPYPIERVEKVDVDRIRQAEHKALMLTQDENIVDVDVGVQYRVRDPKAYLFAVRNPELTVLQAVESAIREVVGKSAMDFVLTEGRTEVAARTQRLAQAILDRYGTGVQLTKVNLKDAQPPEEVQAAFADAIKAREDEQRYKNEAEAYANEIIPKARGRAARQIADANAYKAEVVARAQGETARFLALLREYRRAPRVTRERLYIDAMEQVFGNATKVVVDVEKGSPLLYIPLDRLMRPQPEAPQAAPASPAPAAKPPMRRRAPAGGRFRDLRRREVR